MIRVHVVREPLEVHRLPRRQLVPPAVDPDRLIGQQHLLRRHQGAHAQVEPEIAQQPRRLRSDLLEQHAADHARAHQANRDRVGRQVEPRVHRSQRARGLARIDHHRDVALGGALGDGADVDAGAGERPEHVGGDAGRAGHAVAHDAEDAVAGQRIDVLNLAVAQFHGKGAAHGRGGALGVLFRHREADRMLGAALRDQDDGDPVLTQRAKQPLRGAGHANHPRAFHVDQRHGVDARDALHGVIGRGRRADQGAGLLGRERVPHPDRDAFGHRRGHRLRMDHLGAEVGQLHRLVVRQRVDYRRVGHAPGIGAEHAVDVGPDVNLGGVEHVAEDRRREVRAVASERRLHALRRAGDEAGHDERGGRAIRHQRRGALARHRPLHGRAERTPLHRDDVARVEPPHRAAPAAGAQAAGEHARGPQLAVAGHDVAGFLGGRLRLGRGPEPALDVGRVRVELGRERGDIVSRADLGGDGQVPLPEAGQDRPRRLLPLRRRHQVEQTIGNAFARRQHDGERPGRLPLDDVGHPPHGGRVGDAGSPELEHTPRVRHDSLVRLRLERGARCSLSSGSVGPCRPCSPPARPEGGPFNTVLARRSLHARWARAEPR